MKDFKIRVTEAQSKVVQETCFRNGCRWYAGSNVSNCDREYLYLTDWVFTFGTAEYTFLKHDNPELTFDEFQLEYNGILPKYFAINRVDSPLWQKYIDWLNDKCGDLWGGQYYTYYGIDGNERRKGTDAFNSKFDFKNNAIEITLEQWDSCIKIQENASTKNEEDFPKKWCIRLTEDNLELVGGYYDRDFTEPIYNRKEKIGTYLTSHNLMSGVSITEKEHKCNFIIIGKPKAWVEISTEQFKKYVLKETINTNNMKYKLVKKEYIDAVMGILYNKPSWLAITDEIIIEDPENIQKLKDAGVLHWFEEIQEYQIGDLCYVIDKSNSNLEKGKFYRINAVDDIDVTYHFDNGSGKLPDSCWLVQERFRKATPAEIKKYELLEEAKRRYPVGTKYKSAYDNSLEGISTGEFKFTTDKCSITQVGDTVNGVKRFVYDNGKWAKIIPNEPYITIAGKKVDYYKDYIKIGCTDISLNFIKEASQLPICIYVSGALIPKDTIEDIIKYYINK